MIDHVAIQQEDSGSNVCLCSTCHSSIVLAKRPAESLANFRWVGPMPNELKDLTWIEELLIARAHVVGRVVRLQARNQASYFGIKGHPQDTTLLLDVLPMTPASLPDVIRVVWTGKSAPIETDTVRCSQFAGTLCIMLCNSYVDTTRTTNWSPSITNNSRSGRQCSLRLVRSNTRIRMHRFQSSTSNDVARCSTRPPETGTGEVAITSPYV